MSNYFSSSNLYADADQENKFN